MCKIIIVQVLYILYTSIQCRQECSPSDLGAVLACEEKEIDILRSVNNFVLVHQNTERYASVILP